MKKAGGSLPRPVVHGFCVFLDGDPWDGPADAPRTPRLLEQTHDPGHDAVEHGILRVVLDQVSAAECKPGIDFD
jgi:hypothetical protein